MYIMHQQGTDNNTQVVVNLTIIRSWPLQPPIRLRYFGLVLWCLMPLLTLFQLYRVRQFIGGGNQSTRRKTLTCRKSLTIDYYSRKCYYSLINYKIIYPSLYNQSYIMYHVVYKCKFIQMSWIKLTKRCLTCKGWQHYSHIIIRYICLPTLVWFVFILLFTFCQS